MRGKFVSARFASVEDEIARAFSAGDAWRPRRGAIQEIRASFIRSLLEARNARSSGQPETPFILNGAGRLRIVGRLDWSGLLLEADVILNDIEIEGCINLEGAGFASLIMQNVRKMGRAGAVSPASHNLRAKFADPEKEIIEDTESDEFATLVKDSAKLSASRLIVRGNLVLENLTGFDRLELDDCDIGGSMSLRDLKIPKGLSVRNGKIGGDIAIGGDHGPTRLEVSDGDVDFSGVSTGGRLDLSGLSVHGVDQTNDRKSLRGIALEIRGAKIGGDLRFSRYLLNGNGVQSIEYFEATSGSVLVHSTRVGGDFRCENGFFGGFNHSYFNSLSIYNCSVEGKLVLKRFARSDRAGTVKFKPSARNRPVETSSSKRDDADGWSLDAKISPSSGVISSRIVVFQSNAEIFEIGRPTDKKEALQWKIFDIGDRQITLKGFTYKRLEESTFNPQEWDDLLGKNEPFTGRHGSECCGTRRLRVAHCVCARAAPFDTGPWTIASNVLEQEGQEDAARELRYRREKRFFKWEREQFALQPTSGGFFNLVWTFFIGVFIGYGFKPYRALLHAFAGIAVAFILGVWGWECGLLSLLSGGEFSGEPATREYLSFEPMTFAFDTFLPILDTPQTAYWMSTNRYLEWLFRFVGFWGWLTFAFGAISFTPLVKRN